MAEQQSDEILMGRLKRGDKMVAGVLYDRYYKQLYGYFVRMTNNLEISRDLTQNVFLKILKYSHSWKGDKVFAYWLFRIARNILIDYYNESRKFFTTEEEHENLSSEQVDPIREMDIKESFEFLLEAMGYLKPGDRELIELSRSQGFSYKEMAQILQTNENAVRVKTFRAIQKLKEIYIKIMIA